MEVILDIELQNRMKMLYVVWPLHTLYQNDSQSCISQIKLGFTAVATLKS